MSATRPYSGPERRSRPARSGFQRRLNPFFDLLRWIGAHVRGFHAAVGAVLVLGLGAILLGGLTLVGLTMMVGGGAAYRFDREVLLWMNRRATPALDALAVEATVLAAWWAVLAVALLAGVLFWRTRHRYSAALLSATVAGGFLLGSLLDSVLRRPQPGFGWRVSLAGAGSFSAGQVMLAIAVYATLAFLLLRLGTSSGARRATVAAFAVVALLIALPRTYLGVQYPTDVMAGFAAGTAWAAVCALSFEALRFFRRRSPTLVELERDLDPPVPEDAIAR